MFTVSGLPGPDAPWFHVVARSASITDQACEVLDADLPADVVEAAAAHPAVSAATSALTAATAALASAPGPVLEPPLLDLDDAAAGAYLRSLTIREIEDTANALSRRLSGQPFPGDLTLLGRIPGFAATDASIEAALFVWKLALILLWFALAAALALTLGLGTGPAASHGRSVPGPLAALLGSIGALIGELYWLDRLVFPPPPPPPRPPAGDPPPVGPPNEPPPPPPPESPAVVDHVDLEGVVFSDIRFIDQQSAEVPDGRGLMVSFRRLTDEFPTVDSATFDGPRPAGSDGTNREFHQAHARTYRVEMTLSPAADYRQATFPGLKVRVTVDGVAQLYDLQTDGNAVSSDRIRSKGPIRIYSDAVEGDARATGVRQTFLGRLHAVVRAELVILDANGQEVSTGMYVEQTVARAPGNEPPSDPEGHVVRTVNVRLFNCTPTALGANRVAAIQQRCNELHMQCALKTVFTETHVGPPGINVFEVAGGLPAGHSAVMTVVGVVTLHGGSSAPLNLPGVALPQSADAPQIAQALESALSAGGHPAVRRATKSGLLVLLTGAHSVSAVCSLAVVNASGAPVTLPGGTLSVLVPSDPQHLSFTNGFDVLAHAVLALNHGFDRSKPDRAGRGVYFDVFVLPEQETEGGLIYTRSGKNLLALTWPADVLASAAPGFAANTAAIPVDRLGLTPPSDPADDGRIVAHELAHALANEHDDLHSAKYSTYLFETEAEHQRWLFTQTKLGSSLRKRVTYHFHRRVRDEANSASVLQ